MSETVLKIDRSPRGALHVTLQRTDQGAEFVELQHVGSDGKSGRGSTIKPTELPALVAALNALDVRLRQQRQHDRRRGAAARELEEARADMGAF